MTHTLSRRTALRMLAAGSGSVALAACAPIAPGTGTSATQSSAPTTAPNPAPTAAQNSTTGSSQPKHGGTLRMGILGDPVSLDPYITGIFGETLTPMFEQLIQYDEKLTPLPMLAESWDMNKDQTQIAIHLRRGVSYGTRVDQRRCEVEHPARPAAEIHRVPIYDAAVDWPRHAGQVHPGR